MTEDEIITVIRLDPEKAEFTEALKIMRIKNNKEAYGEVLGCPAMIVTNHPCRMFHGHYQLIYNFLGRTIGDSPSVTSIENKETISFGPVLILKQNNGFSGLDNKDMVNIHRSIVAMKKNDKIQEKHTYELFVSCR